MSCQAKPAKMELDTKDIEKKDNKVEEPVEKPGEEKPGERKKRSKAPAKDDETVKKAVVLAGVWIHTKYSKTSAALFFILNHAAHI